MSSRSPRRIVTVYKKQHPKTRKTYRESNRKFCWDGQEHTLLSNTSAMACPGYGLLALHACPGAVCDSPEDICFSCYAQINRYADKDVEKCQAARFAWTVYMVQNHPDEWVDIMVEAILETRCNLFRWHDSGDIFSAAYCRCLIEVCRRTPGVFHWFPTRSWHLPWVNVLRELHALPNVVVRPSAIKLNDPAPVVEGLGVGTTSVTDRKYLPEGHHMCPKTSAFKLEQNDPNYVEPSCANQGCRRCYYDVPGAEPSAFLLHGWHGNHKVSHPSLAILDRRAAACKTAFAATPR